MSLLQQLPEVIEQIGRDIKAITVVLGRGRPDKPDTTGDKITGEEPKIKGNEPNGTIYESSDGGGVGAWKWQKRNKKWVVIDGDTGLVTVATKNPTNLSTTKFEKHITKKPQPTENALTAIPFPE